MRPISLLIGLLSLLSCSSSSDNTSTPEPQPEAAYFPPITGSEWETKTPASLGWDETALQPLLDYLELKHSKSFMILVNGRIVVEHYFNGHTATSPWYWASAGKTLTATTFGIAEQEGFVNRGDRVSDYLGTGWTTLPLAKENLVTNRHLLTMTSGIEDLANGDCVTPDCLTYKADAGTRWAYHNVFVKLQDVVAEATGMSYNEYFNTRLRDKIGMTGTWVVSGDNIVYWSTTRSMARFGLLALHQGKWDTQTIVNSSFFHDATTTSQNINQAYGFLWWLNGKSSYHLPQTQFEFQGSVIPSGPADMYMALGKNDQKIYVVPSKKMVIIRMGDAADDVNLTLSDFDDVLWEKITALIR
ncbi:MAG TPA: serine hydrolase [Flavobacterium sp.]|nr:serine hydrolase [Flavobacterium sp.]